MISLTEEQLEAIYFLNKYTKVDVYHKTKGTWSINKKTGLVDIDGDFICKNEGLKDFKGVKFGRVTGYFDCSCNNLTSLVGAPQKVRGWFHCHDNKLTSLVGAPQEIGRWFDCSSNNLTSLEGAPQEVGGHFRCWSEGNQISIETLELVWGTMKKNKIDYWKALCILKGQIDSDEWDKMTRGYEDRITPEAIKTYSIVSRYSF